MKLSLQNIQTDFQEYVLAPHSETPAIVQFIAQQHGLNAGDRLAIYHNAYRARLREALGEAFEKTHSYLGDDLFAELSDGYIQATPSQSRNLRWYGDGFPAYLKGALNDHPCVAELATFEWTLGLAFDADDAPLLSADELRILTPEQWERLSLALHPSLRILSLQWNVVAIWLALEQKQIPPEATEIATPLSPSWLVWRKQLQPHFRSLDTYEALALSGLQQGRRFSAVCEEASISAREEDITPKIAGWLQSWLGDAVLTRIQW